MKYIVLTEQSNTLLEKEVNKYLQQGWVLYGNLAVCSSSHHVSFSQAMILEK